jgi:hypothetical protein
MLPFGVSIVLLSLFQGGLVALPASRRLPLPNRLRSALWALVPAVSIVAVVLSVRAASTVANVLAYVALVAVPPLAAVALGWGIRGARPPLALAAIALFALAWFDRSGLAGEAAATLLAGLACVTLALLAAQLAPAVWVKRGIVIAALIDTALVVSDQLQAPNAVLNAAHPAAGLPQLQRALFGSAVIGFGDLFVAALLGAVYVGAARRQNAAALLTAALALGSDLLFLAVHELPATVPVAVAMLLVEARARRLDAGRSRPV